MYKFPIVFAYTLDLIFGDPRWFPHPIRGIGWLIKTLERPIQRIFYSKKIAGIAFCFIIVGISYSLVSVVIILANNISVWLGFLVSVFFIYASLSIKDLKDHSILIYRSLKKGNIFQAQKRLSMFVGRDTDNLDKKSIIRATVESISENTTDGIISPLFYAFLAGAPLAIAYKAINTLDSMIGYKDRKYKEFGWFSAKLDDLANFIPARLSVFFVSLASWVLKKNFKGSWKTALCDGNKNPSPNSGYSEAAFAGALGIELGGEAFYNGRLIKKPTIGKYKHALNMEHIKEAIKISYICSVFTLILGLALVLIF